MAMATNGQGKAADGYPGITGLGAKTAAKLINQHRLEKFPAEILKAENRKHALLFKELATLRVDAPLFK